MLMTRRLKIACGNSAAMLLASNLELLQLEFGAANNFGSLNHSLSPSGSIFSRTDY